MAQRQGAARRAGSASRARGGGERAGPGHRPRAQPAEPSLEEIGDVSSASIRRTWFNASDPRARTVVGEVGFAVEIIGIEAPDMGQKCLRQFAPLDLVVGERMLQ